MSETGEAGKAGRLLSKFTPERTKAILADIAEYVPYKIAAESNGIADSTWYDWLYNGVRDMKLGIESDYTRLVESLRDIEKDRIKELTKDTRTSEKGHKGAEWVLERVFWKHFSSSVPVMEFEERLLKLEGTSHEEKGNEKERNEKGNEKA